MSRVTSRAMFTGPNARGVARAVAIIAGYIALLAVLTWPLAGSLLSFLPRAAVGFAWQHDLHYSIWAMAHGSHALSSAASFADANIYYPADNAFFYGPTAIGALQLFAPVFLVSGNPALATNVTLLLGLALTGAAMHYIVYRWTGSDLAGVVAASTVLLNHWLLWGFVSATPHWATLFWLPIIAFLAATRLDTSRAALALIPLLVLQCLTDLVYMTPTVFGPLGVLAGLRLLKPSTRLAGIRLGVALVITLVMLAPLYYFYLSVASSNPDLGNQTKWVTTESALPSVLPERLFEGFGPLLLTPSGLVLIAIGACAALLRRRSHGSLDLPGGWAHGALWLIVGAGLSLHPVVQIGQTEFTSPLGILVSLVPSLDAIRVPSRLGLAGLIGFGVLSGVAFGEINGRIRDSIRSRGLSIAVSSALAVVVVLLAYNSYAGSYRDLTGPKPMPETYPIQHTQPPVPKSFLPYLESADAAVVVLPAGPGQARPWPHTRAMYRSIGHWYPLLNGYSSYWPASFIQDMATAGELPAPEALESLVESTGVALVWLNGTYLTPQQRVAWAAPPKPAGGKHGLVLVARDGVDRLFAVRPQPPTRAR